MMTVLVVFNLLWGIGLGWTWRNLDAPRPMIWLVQGEVEFATVLLAGAFVETLLVLGACFL
jgi:hypothetical protein